MKFLARIKVVYKMGRLRTFGNPAGGILFDARYWSIYALVKLGCRSCVLKYHLNSYSRLLESDGKSYMWLHRGLSPYSTGC